jgi:recombination protein RecT
VSTAIERAGDSKPSVRQLIQQMTPEIKKALPAHLDADRIARIAITLIGTNRALAECTPESFLGALMTASQLGLEPGPLGEAYLVPYGKQVTFIAGYKGLIKLAYQSGQLKRIDAHVIREHDEFDFAYGSDPYLRHKPQLLADRGRAIGVYATAELTSGAKPFVVLAVDEIERHRRRSRAADKGPWVTDWDAMARKTAVRGLARWLPLSPDLRNFATAAHLDGSVRTVAAHAEVGSVDEVTYDEPPMLEPARPVVSTAEIRQQGAPPADDGHRPTEMWHRDGHLFEDGHPRAFNPECPVCLDADPEVVLAGKRHLYNHTVDWVDDCPLCQLEKTWRDEEQTNG